LTSGATEANNLVLRGHLRADPKNRILVAEDCHPSARFVLDEFPDRCAALPLNEGAPLGVRQVADALRPGTTMVCLSHACNETGTIHAVESIAAFCARRGIACLVDGVQALGRLAVDLEQIPAAAYTFS